jgi:hypothetical protein
MATNAVRPVENSKEASMASTLLGMAASEPNLRVVGSNKTCESFGFDFAASTWFIECFLSWAAIPLLPD